MKNIMKKNEKGENTCENSNVIVVLETLLKPL